MKTRILIVDDHQLLRHGLRQALEQQPDLLLVGEAATGTEALRLAAELKPDLVVMDLHLPDISGVEATRRILEAVPAAKVVALSGDAGRSLVDAALQAGACGYILKQTGVEELLRAIQIVLAGRLYLSPEVSAGILEDYRKSLAGEAVAHKPSLSQRERQMLRLVAEGKRNKEIAIELDLSENSIETYRARLAKKLGCPSTAELVRYAIREGILDA